MASSAENGQQQQILFVGLLVLMLAGTCLTETTTTPLSTETELTTTKPGSQTQSPAPSTSEQTQPETSAVLSTVLEVDSSSTGTTATPEPVECIVCNGTNACSDINENTTTCISSTGICYVLYDLANNHVKMSCMSKESGDISASNCLSHFASNVAGGFCEYCCTSQHCNDDWTLAHVRDDCVMQSAAATPRHCQLISAVFISAVYWLMLCD